MRKRGWAAAVTLLALACGEQRRPPPPPPAPPVAKAKPEPAPAVRPPPAADAPDERQRTELRSQRAELAGRIAELGRALKELEARHARERAGLPKIDTPARRRFLRYVEDARTAEFRLRRAEQRLQQLESVAKRELTGKLKELTDRRDEIEQRRAVIDNVWQRALDKTRYGKIEESPVKAELYCLRAVKRRWFDVSVPARQGRLTADTRRKILQGFRAWLDEVPARKQVVAKALAQPLGPKRKTPDDYDFTDLDFYILLEVLEDTLDRQNIALENRELAESRRKLAQIRTELGAVTQEINEALAEGGSELAEYLELLGRLPTTRENASYLAGRVMEWARIFRQIGELDARQAKEREEAEAALTRARRELAHVEAELRRLG